MLNRIVLIGNLTRDPELKYTTSGLPVAQFGIAVNRRSKGPDGNREVDFFTVVAWRQTAEFVSQYAAKGKKVAVDGRVQIRSYVAQDGTKRSVTEVVADNVELLDSSREQGGGAGAPSSQGDAGQPASNNNEPDDFADPFSEN